jgi:putative Ca2+/H+ antiporter (TMEM165/GDT1 family)
MRAYVMVFLSVLVAEMGDKTQLATLLFATDSTLSRSGVLVAAAAALVTSTLVAVLAGSLAGVGFIAIGAWMLAHG